MKKLVFFVFVLLGFQAYSQTYFGAGYTIGTFSKTNVYEARGVSFSILKEFELGDSRFRIDPTLNIALFISEIDTDPTISYFGTMTSLTPSIAFELIKIQKVNIAPFAGPYANWLIAETNSLLFNEDYINKVRFGFEFGLAVNVLIKDNFSIKVVPIDYQVARFKGDAIEPDSRLFFLKFSSSILIRL